MEQKHLGASGPLVSAVGFGGMGLSDLYGAPVERNSALALIRLAVDSGVSLLDTGDFYGMGHNEQLFGEALSDIPRDHYRLSVKFGSMRGPDGSWNGIDGRPIAVENFAAYSLRRLNTDYIDIYRLSRLDPNVPIEETVGAISRLIEKGYVRYVGLSELGVENIQRAAKVHPISDLQIEYSIFARGIESKILPVVRQLGIGLTAYGVLARGLLSGKWKTGQLSDSDFRSGIPWFSRENLPRNLDLVEKLRSFGEARGLTVAQLAVAWVAAQGDAIVPLVGATAEEHLADGISGATIKLTPHELAEIETLVPASSVAGSRSSGEQLAIMDSEK